MPELPEVETTRLRMERALKGKVLEEVILDCDDRIAFDRDEPEDFRSALQGARVLGSERRGKYFWLKLDRRPWPVIHLGMTGNLEIRKPAPGRAAAASGRLKLWRSPGGASSTDLPGVVPYCRLRLIADDGTDVAITDPRRFGRMRLAREPLKEKPISELGFDPLHDFPSSRELGAILVKRKAPIKAVLLDQNLFAGVGNWIADEILFQSRIAPHRKASELSTAEIAKLRSKLLLIIRKAVAVRADYEHFPKTWLFHARWGKDKEARTSRGLKIVHDTIGGRTTAWVPSIQK